MLRDKDVNQGLSRFGENISELELDCPNIHKSLMETVIKPLQSLSIVNMKFVKWKVDEPKKADEDEDDIDFGTEPLFKLWALILVDLRKHKKSW